MSLGNRPGAGTSEDVSDGVRSWVKSGLSLRQVPATATGATLLIYHRVGGGTRDELDLPVRSFARQLKILEGHEVVSLDEALDRLDAGDRDPSVVLTFDDGFEDVYANAWPLLRERQLPFTVYVASSFMSAPMRWEGSTSTAAPGRGMSWSQLAELVDSGLCTIGNHTHTHVRPESLTTAELDECSEVLRQRLSLSPRHFTYPWGVPVPAMEEQLRARFRSVSTGLLGRNLPETDRMRLMRVPVRRSDPDAFFAAKLNGGLGPERAYARLVRVGKALGLKA